MSKKKKKIKNEFQFLKESKRKYLIQIGMWFPKEKVKPSGKLYKKNKKYAD